MSITTVPLDIQTILAGHLSYSELINVCRLNLFDGCNSDDFWKTWLKSTYPEYVSVPKTDTLREIAYYMYLWENGRYLDMYVLGIDTKNVQLLAHTDSIKKGTVSSSNILARYIDDLASRRFIAETMPILLKSGIEESMVRSMESPINLMVKYSDTGVSLDVLISYLTKDKLDKLVYTLMLERPFIAHKILNVFEKYITLPDVLTSTLRDQEICQLDTKSVMNLIEELITEVDAYSDRQYMVNVYSAVFKNILGCHKTRIHAIYQVYFDTSEWGTVKKERVTRVPRGESDKSIRRTVARVFGWESDESIQEESDESMEEENVLAETINGEEAETIIGEETETIIGEETETIIGEET